MFNTHLNILKDVSNTCFLLLSNFYKIDLKEMK